VIRTCGGIFEILFLEFFSFSLFQLRDGALGNGKGRGGLAMIVFLYFLFIYNFLLLLFLS